MNKDNNNYSHRYCLDKFIVNDNNKEAYSACLTFMSTAWKGIGILFIYGKPGTGKTHLLVSLYHQVKEAYPDIKIIYKPIYQLINEFIESIRDKKLSSFLEDYYNLDILLLDDFDELKGMDATQKEISHIIDKFLIKDKKIVIAGLYHPKKYNYLSKKLLSRLTRGNSIKIK